MTWIPPWLELLEDQHLVRGEALIVHLGAPYNIYGELMKVNVRLGSATYFTTYETDANALYVHAQESLSYVGVYPITVTA